MARRSSDIIVGLDIGTTKIAAVVGEIGESGLDGHGVEVVARRARRIGGLEVDRHELRT
jgi:cell division ATPase FtsA